jgi:hypothetical protein
MIRRAILKVLKISILNKLFRTLPVNVSDNISDFGAIVYKQPNFISNLNLIKDNFDNNEIIHMFRNKHFEGAFITLFNDVIVFADSGFIMGRFNKLLLTKSHPWKDNFYKKEWFCLSLNPFHKSINIKNKICYLAVPNNYWHFHMEFIFRALFIKELFPEIIIFTTEFKFEWQKDLLEIYGLTKGDFNYIDNSLIKYLRVDSLYFPYFPNFNINNHTSPFAIKLLKRNIRLNNSNDVNKRIYVTRKNARYRKLINEDLLINYLKDYGFKVVDCDKMTVYEQYKMFSQSIFIIAIHGPALMNCIVSKNAYVVEIFNPDWPIYAYPYVVGASDRYNIFFAKSIDNFNPPQSANISIDILDFIGKFENFYHRSFFVNI